MLANDPRFDAAQRAQVAALPEVSSSIPFLVAFGGTITEPKGLDQGGGLLPTTAAGDAPLAGVVVSGRIPHRADEAAIDQNAARVAHLRIGSTLVFSQQIPDAEAAQFPPGLLPRPTGLSFTARVKVVGIAKSVSAGVNWSLGADFYRAHADQLVGVVNLFVDLRHGDADLPRFQRDLQHIAGHPVNVKEFATDSRKTGHVMTLERTGLLLFALAVLVGGGALVGQALIRTVTGGLGDLATWRAIGANRRVQLQALVLPSVVTAACGALVAGATAIALSPRFPIGLARQYDLDLGVHADWPVIALGMLVLVVAVVATAVAAGWWRVARGEATVTHASVSGDWAMRTRVPVALAVGTRLALEPGRGRRSVPVRSALTGAIVGVLGVAACFTFRAGIDDATRNPQRSGIVWDYEVANALGEITPAGLAQVQRDPSVAAALDAQWFRALQINGSGTPTFGTQAVKGDLEFVMLAGRAPRGPDEIAFAPVTMKKLHLAIGDTARVGTAPGRIVAVVGEALVPATSHTDYDESAWMTLPGLRAAMPPAASLGADDLWDQVLVRWKPGTDRVAAQHRVVQIDGGEYDALAPTLPDSVSDLGRMRALPLWLGIFFALLAIATVAHALVTTVRRWRHDFAVLRSIGFTRRQSRVRDRLAVDLARRRRCRDRAPARHRGRATRVAVARRQFPVRLRPAARARRGDRDRARRARARQRARRRTGARGRAHPAGGDPARRVTRRAVRRGGG